MSEENNSLNTVIQFSKKYTWEEQEVSEIILDPSKVTGEHVLDAANEMEAKGVVSFAQLSIPFQIKFIEKVTGLHENFFKKLAINDFMQVQSGAQSFLLNTSGRTPEKKSEKPAHDSQKELTHQQDTTEG
jgi:hypothetical protein